MIPPSILDTLTAEREQLETLRLSGREIRPAEALMLFGYIIKAPTVCLPGHRIRHEGTQREHS